MSLPDKRYLPRWEVHNRISFHLDPDEKEQECLSRDLSSVGICLETQAPIPLHSKVKLRVHLSKSNSFPVDGRVVWSRPTSSGYLSGVLFEKIAPQDQEMIFQFAFEVRHQEVVNNWFKGWNA